MQCSLGMNNFSRLNIPNSTVKVIKNIYLLLTPWLQSIQNCTIFITPVNTVETKLHKNYFNYPCTLEWHTIKTLKQTTRTQDKEESALKRNRQLDRNSDT